MRPGSALPRWSGIRRGDVYVWSTWWCAGTNSSAVPSRPVRALLRTRAQSDPDKIVHRCSGSACAVGHDENQHLFFRTSPNRTQILKDAIDEFMPESQRRTLRSLCETRWIEGAEACISSKSLYIPVLAALAKISESEPEAHSYLISVNEKRFVFCLCLLSVAMAALKTLSEQLQSSSTTLPKV
ncbi:hypothetical protein Aduo_011505 [Ancylostoma duodenale]